MELTQAPWFEANPYLLQRELDALAALNIEHEINSTLQHQGILQIGLIIDPENPAFSLPAGQEPIQLEAVFPDNYPFFRPEVWAPNVTLARHQEPFSKGLCLLPRASKHWNVEWTLAELLQTQLPKVLEKGMIVDSNILAADPNEQAEPVTEYYGNSRTKIIFDSSSFDTVETTNTELTVLGRIRVGLTKQKIVPGRMAVLECTSLDKKILSQVPTAFQDLFPVICDGYALRLEKLPPHGHPINDLLWLRELIRKHKHELRSRPLVGLKEIGTKRSATITNVWALNVPEEVKPGEMGRGWLFLIEGTVEVPVRSGNKTVQRPERHAYYAQVARSGLQDIQLRIPALTHLADCTIAIVGLGALGAPAAIEFARNQTGELRLMDFDQVEPATTVRWPLGASAFGQQKTEALRDFIQLQYPKTSVNVIEHKIGHISISDRPTEQQVLDKLLTGTSLLFDASAEPGVSHFLSTEAKKRGIPYILLYATPGAWGGLIMRVVPGKMQGCWMCLEYSKDHTIPVPRSNVDGQMQAPGCGDLTFTGASFDLQNISLAAVRLAVSTLCGGMPAGYPDVSWDVGIVSLVDAHGLPIPPDWKTFSLEVHPQCPYCSKS